MKVREEHVHRYTHKTIKIKMSLLFDKQKTNISSDNFNLFLQTPKLIPELLFLAY